MIAQITQFKRPDGREVNQTINISDDCQEGYNQMLESNCRLTAEVLMDGQVSLCIESNQEDCAIEVVNNGPEVMEAIKKMLLGFTTQKHEKRDNKQIMEAGF